MLVPTLSLVILTLWAQGTWGLKSQFNVSALDCDNPTAVHRYSLPSACSDNASSKPTYTQETITLLQSADFFSYSAWVCKEEVTTSVIRCGMFAHAEVVEPLKVQRPRTIPASQCKQMALMGLYSAPDGSVHNIISGDNYFTFTDKGILGHANGKIICEGEKVKIGDDLLDGIIKTTDHKLSVTKEIVREMYKTGDLEIPNLHVAIPQGDVAGEGVQYPTFSVHFMRPHQTPCHLESTRKVLVYTLTDLSGTAISVVGLDSKVDLELTSRYHPPLNCPQPNEQSGLFYYNTRHASLFVLRGKVLERDIRRLSTDLKVLKSHLRLDSYEEYIEKVISGGHNSLSKVTGNGLSHQPQESLSTTLSPSHAR